MEISFSDSLFCFLPLGVRLVADVFEDKTGNHQAVDGGDMYHTAVDLGFVGT